MTFLIRVDGHAWLWMRRELLRSFYGIDIHSGWIITNREADSNRITRYALVTLALPKWDNPITVNGKFKTCFTFADETDHRHMMGLHHGSSDNGDSKSSAGIPIPPSKPKIWSLADTAVCKTPPPPNHSAQTGHGQPPGCNTGQHYGQSGQQPGAQPSQYLPTSAAWGPNFSQFVTDPNLMRLRHPGLGMGYMGLPPPPVSQPSFSSGPLGHPTASPGLNSDGVQSNNDTPPHTPPNGPKPSQFGLAGSGGNSSYNSLHNGYSQMSPSLQGEAGGVASAASKMLMFNQMNNASSFKMMWNYWKLVKFSQRKTVFEPPSFFFIFVCFFVFLPKYPLLPFSFFSSHNLQKLRKNATKLKSIIISQSWQNNMVPKTFMYLFPFGKTTIWWTRK